MSSFRRSFNVDPGLTVLGEIESINIIDNEPPATPLGAGSGVVCLVGEFENGPFNIPTQVFGGAEMESIYGGLGWIKSDTPYSYCVAEQSAGAPAPWAGNAYIALKKKRMAGLILCRVDGSAGSVEFSRLASITGEEVGPWSLDTGFTLNISVDGAAAVVATFTGTAATITAVAGTFPTLFVGGETLEISIDGNPTQIVTFQAGDQSNTQVRDRINSSVAATIADVSGGQVRLSSLVGGWTGSIEVVGGTALATIGFPSAPVAEVDTMTVTGASSSVTWTASIATVNREDGTTVTYTATYASDGSGTIAEIRDGLLTSWLGQSTPGVTFTAGGAGVVLATADENVSLSAPTITPGGAGTGTFTETTAPVLTLTYGAGNCANIDAVTLAEFITIVTALTGVVADSDEDNFPRINNDATALSGELEIVAPSTGATALGFSIGSTAAAGTGGVSGTISAGTLLNDSGNDVLWITMEDVTVTEDDGGPYEVRVRPATDTDTAPTCDVGDCDEIVDTLFTGFIVNNTAALSRLTNSQMDSRYVEAIESTLDTAGVSHDINQIFSARSTGTINRALSQIASQAAATGHRHRKALISPPIGTTKTVARGSTAVGVGANRDRRTMYLFPAMSIQVPELASIGSAGGVGFTDDGVIDVPSCGFYAAVRSLIPPEENAGQQLSDTNYGNLDVVGLEASYDRSREGEGLTMQDYIAFKAAGIIAPRPDRLSGMVFQSDVTSVSPVTNPGLVDAKRQYFADFIYDSLQDIASKYSKKMSIGVRRQNFKAAVVMFLEILKSSTQPEVSRLDDYAVKDDTTKEQRAAGFQIFKLGVRQHASMDYIVFRSTVGTTVSIEEI